MFRPAHVFAIATLLYVAVCQTAYAGWTVREYLDTYQKAAPPDRELREQLISSAEQGISMTNAYVGVNMKQTRAYCPPRDHRFSGAELLGKIADQLKVDPKMGDYPVVFTLLLTLIRNYPCVGS